jgi:hypothetical protein
MQEINALSASLIAIIAGFAGAFLQARLSRKNQEKNRIVELKNKAYVDFLTGVSGIALSQRQRAGNKEKEHDALVKLTNAKSKICIYGESDVIKKLATFAKNDSNLQTESGKLSFTKLYLSMRNSIGMYTNDLDSSDISVILFGVDIKNTETPKQND